MPPLVKEQVSNLLAANSNTDCVCKAKCVLVGDGAIGKTSLIVSYTTNGYPTEYVPTAFDNYSVVVNVNNEPIRLQLCDTAGQTLSLYYGQIKISQRETKLQNNLLFQGFFSFGISVRNQSEIEKDDFDSLRPLCYPQTDVFLLCYSVVSPTSFHNLREKWIGEIRSHCQKIPILLVGTQCDLRTDVNVLIDLAKYHEQPVSEHEAAHFASRIGAVGHLECSALTQKNLKEVFDAAILAALSIQKPDLVAFDNSKSKSRISIRKQKNYSTSSRFVDSKHKKSGWKRFCCFL